MRASRIAVAVAVLGLAGAARAESPVRGNYVDDFAVVAATSVPSADVQSTVLSSGSRIAANYVDDFGSLLPRSVTAPAERDEFGAASGEPGQAPRIPSVERPAAKAGVEAYQHEAFVQAVWGQP